MKKFLLALFIVFLANLGCKKLDKSDGGVCACSPAYEPTLVLVVKNAAGADMLNPATPGHFENNNIQLYSVEGGIQKKLNFYVRTPFSYGNDKFNFYQLHSSEIIRQFATNNKEVYLKLGNNASMKVSLELITDTKFEITKLLIDNKEATAEQGNVKAYVQNLFYLNLNDTVAR